MIPSLSKNKICDLVSWSALEETVRYLNCHEETSKTQILHQQLRCTSARKFGMKLYDADTIVRAFEYFVTSRALYHKLGEDFQLPSVSTLTRITSTVAKQGDSDFLKNVFKSLDEKQKLCVVLHDEVYIKKMMTYHGGTIYGKATNDSSALLQQIIVLL